MKKFIFILPIVLFSMICLLAIGAFQGAVITGTVQPVKSVTNVYAIAGKDTFSGSLLENSFEISKLRTGTYTVVIETEPPYQKALRENIQVTDGQVTNIGEIKLEK